MHTKPCPYRSFYEMYSVTPSISVHTRGGHIEQILNAVIIFPPKAPSPCAPAADASHEAISFKVKDLLASGSETEGRFAPIICGGH